jgi:peptide/nickel transport system substrate-binding protein
MIMDTINTEPLKDKRVRQAINYAVNKKAIIKGVLSGKGIPLGTHVPRRVNGANLTIQPYPYNPDKAKSLLKEAGYADGFSLNLNTPNGRYPMDREVTLAIADQLSKVGIKAKVNAMETGSYFKGLVNKTLTGLFFIGMGSGEWDISDSLNQLPSNFVLCYYPNNEMNERVARAKQTMDLEVRYKLASEIQQIVHEEAPYLFLYNGMAIFGVSGKIENFTPRSDDMMDLWEVSLLQ